MFEQFESITDFLHDATPLTREYIIDFMKKMDEFDRKGYFEFIKESVKIFDNIVTSFTVDDVKKLGDNIVTIMNTVKNLTQPDMLQAINNATDIYKKIDIEVSKDISLYKLLKEINTPEMKRGLAFSIQFLKSLAKEPEENNSIKVN
jgi:uncharacterized protein YjgD (DUF1641 family)